MKKKITLLSLSLFCLLLLTACGNAPQDTTVKTDKKDEIKTTDVKEVTEVEPPNQPVKEKKLMEQELVFSWVDKLNIREEPKTSSPVIANISEKDPLIFTGEQTDFTEKIELRGKLYDEPWIKVITADKKTGWVFRGAVKRKGEAKGNAMNTANNFSFLHFGNFNLAEWKKENTKDESGGDAEIETKTYTKGDRILEITISEVGEYGYSRTHKLMDANRKLLKHRELRFTVDPGFVLTEEIFDYETKPAKKYTRTQKFKQHFMQMKSKPESVVGAFKEQNIK